MSRDDRPPLVVEFVGLPCAGKSRLSQTVATRLSNRDIDVAEPTRQLAESVFPWRVPLKVTYSAIWATVNPRQAIAIGGLLRRSDQSSVGDLAKVAFNVAAVSGILQTASWRDCDVVLLDQGLYQAVWSIAWSASDDWFEANDAPGRLPEVRPDLVVDVAAASAVIKKRMQARTENDSRWILTDDGMSRGQVCLELVRDLIDVHQQIGDKPDRVTVDNNSPRDLRDNAQLIETHILDAIDYNELSRDSATHGVNPSSSVR